MYKTKTPSNSSRNHLKLAGSNVIVDRSRNEKQQDLRLSTNLTRVFVLYITLPKVQNEDPFKIVLKSLQNGSNVIVNRSRNKKQHDLRLLQHAGRYKILIFLSVRERAVFYKYCDLIGSGSGQYSPIRPAHSGRYPMRDESSITSLTSLQFFIIYKDAYHVNL